MLVRVYIPQSKSVLMTAVISSFTTLSKKSSSFQTKDRLTRKDGESCKAFCHVSTGHIHNRAYDFGNVKFYKNKSKYCNQILKNILIFI